MMLADTLWEHRRADLSCEITGIAFCMKPVTITQYSRLLAMP